MRRASPIRTAGNLGRQKNPFSVRPSGFPAFPTRFLQSGHRAGADSSCRYPRRPRLLARRRTAFRQCRNITLRDGDYDQISRLITLTFFLSTPGVAEATAGGFPAISAAPGQFLLKDLVLLAASLSLLLASLRGPWLNIQKS